MPTQKVLKRRVRTRMAKTGESYTSARMQLIRKADEEAAKRPTAEQPTVETQQQPTAAPPTSDAATLRATGRSQDDWYKLIDESGIATRGHTAIARWLVGEHGVDGWWSQSITVGYERVRGLRAQHQMKSGFAVTVNRTIAAGAEAALAAFTDPAVRSTWLPGVDPTRRRTTAHGTARFDWPDPASRLAVWAVPKDDGRTVVSVTHEKLPDLAAAEDMKSFWRARLGILKEQLERPG